jgi:hypothetical protein
MMSIILIVSDQLGYAPDTSGAQRLRTKESFE